MKQSEKLKTLEKAMRTLNDTQPQKPNPKMLSHTHHEDMEYMSKTALISAISENDYWFSFGDDCGFICWESQETEAQANARYEKEVEKMNKWNEDVDRINRLIDEERIAMKNAKKILDARYSDPEYIDYLRMQTKMKERGLV